MWKGLGYVDGSKNKKKTIMKKLDKLLLKLFTIPKTEFIEGQQLDAGDAYDFIIGYLSEELKEEFPRPDDESFMFVQWEMKLILKCNSCKSKSECVDPLLRMYMPIDFTTELKIPFSDVMCDYFSNGETVERKCENEIVNCKGKAAKKHYIS